MKVTDDERVARAALTHLVEPGDREIGEHVQACGPVAVLAGIRDGTLSSPRVEHYRARLPSLAAERDLERCSELGGRFVCPGEAEWPTQLDDLGFRRPIGLWLRGDRNLRVAGLTSVAVVGSRSSTTYGEHVAGELAASLAERGWTVVSGGAFGIDACAHRGALAVSGLTAVVLASGVDVLYPRGNHSLLRRIADEGLVISEVPPRRAPTRYRFLERNRVIAALTRGTVVVEAAYRSGALNTARTAGDLGRQVMAVPGPVTSVMSTGVHLLVREQGAVLVGDADEIIEQVGLIGDDLAPRRRGVSRPRDRLDSITARVLDAVPVRSGAPELVIAQSAGVDPDSVVRCLGALEADGWVSRTGGGWRLTPHARSPISPSDSVPARDAVPVLDNEPAPQSALECEVEDGS
jgi:DNA processing protein